MEKKTFEEILKDIAPYVIVTGSYAYGEQTVWSDIDLFVRGKSDEEREKQAETEGIDWCDTDEDYVKELIRYFEALGYTWDSCFISSFSVDDTEIPLEFSAFYDIDNNLFDIEINGVKMKASKSNYTGGRYVNGRKIKQREEEKPQGRIKDAIER